LLLLHHLLLLRWSRALAATAALQPIAGYSEGLILQVQCTAAHLLLLLLLLLLPQARRQECTRQ